MTNDSAQRAATALDKLDDVAAEYAAAALQALHVEDLLEHIPLIKTAMVAAKIIGSVRDHLLLKKIGIYLRAISIIPPGERRVMVARLAADPGFKEDLGEHLIELLDRLDGRRKPAMVGAVFAAYAFETIDSTVLRRLNYAIQILPAMEINAVRLLDDFNRASSEMSKTTRESPDRLSMQAIANAGLAQPDNLASGIWYKLNETGQRFLELDLDGIDPAG